MKIIATTGRSGFVITATADELARVAGFPYSTQHHEAMRRDLGIGDVIEVVAMYDRLVGIRQSEKRLTEAQATLRAVADLIGPVADCVVAASADEVQS